MKVFPTCLFAPNRIEADIERRIVSGGQAISGDEDRIATDGGGRVFAEFSDFYLDDPDAALAWRALSAQLEDGIEPVVVPFMDLEHQPSTGVINTLHSDGTPFDDDAEYQQTAGDVRIAVPAPLRATEMQLLIVELPRPLKGGEWFSINHPVHSWRAYRVTEIVEQTATSATVRFRPPLREATVNGPSVDFANPRCVMRLDSEMRSPTNIGYAEGSPLRFVEHFPPPGGYL